MAFSVYFCSQKIYEEKIRIFKLFNQILMSTHYGSGTIQGDEDIGMNKIDKAS